MTIDEAKTVFLNRGYIEVEGETIYDADKWRESCRVISEWLEQEPSGDAVSREAVDDILCLYSDGNGMIDARGAVRMVQDLPSVKPQEPKWIPVSERLPQINEWVLCQCRAGYKVLRLTSYGCYCNDTQEYMDSFVIAWMPLPPCFEPQESEK